MATRCSATTVFRVFVLFGCLVAVPAVAISGKLVPERLKRLIAQGWPAQRASSAENCPDNVTWRLSPEAVRPAPPAALPQGEGVVGTCCPAYAAADRSAERSAWAESAGMVPVHWSPDDFRLRDCPDFRVSENGTVAVSVAAGEPVAVGPLQPVDPSRRVQERLRQLGATYYLLEPWGQQERLYRFCCRVAVAGSPDYTRHFEATDARPLAAMAEVLRDVEAWRAER